MNEFEQWRPVSDLPKEFLNEGLHDDFEGFRIILREIGGEQRILRVRFDNPICYRNSQESFRLTTWSRTSSMKGFCRSDSSDWIRWVREEAEGALDTLKLVHYVVMTPLDVVEVICDTCPEADWLT